MASSVYIGWLGPIRFESGAGGTIFPVPSTFMDGSTSILAITSTAVTSAVPVLAPDGSAAAPGYSFSGETTLGAYRPASNQLAFMNAGYSTVPVAAILATGIRVGGAATIEFGSGNSAIGAADVSLSRGAANRLDLATGDSLYLVSGGLGVNIVNTAAGTIAMTEQTAPSAPAANGVILYAVDNGGGKTQLMALFSSGAAQQLAIQP